MEIPDDGWLVQQRNSVGGRNALCHQLLFVRIKGIAMLIEILAGDEGELHQSK